MTSVIVLVGPHGAGKSTTGARLAARLGVPFHDEIGRRLAEDARWRPECVRPDAPQLAFDREVLRRERARDLQAPCARVVESWHPMNLAYALERGASDLEPEARAAIAAVPSVTVVPLVAATGVLTARRTEAAAVAFFERVAARAVDVARTSGLGILPPVDTSTRCPDAVVSCVLELLEGST